jgi:hypothetical protein
MVRVVEVVVGCFERGEVVSWVFLGEIGRREGDYGVGKSTYLRSNLTQAGDRHFGYLICSIGVGCGKNWELELELGALFLEQLPVVCGRQEWGLHKRM